MSLSKTLRSLAIATTVSAQACGPSVSGNSTFDTIQARKAQCETDNNTVEGIQSEILCQFGKASEGTDATSAVACGVADTEEDSVKQVQKKMKIMIEGLCPEGRAAHFNGTPTEVMATRRGQDATTVFGRGTEYNDSGFVACGFIGYDDGFECKINAK